MQMTNKLEIRNLTKDYEKGTPVAQDVSFNVLDGEFLSVLGASGCGKTTLLRMLIGILPPTSGTVFKDGSDITLAHPSHRGMGIVFQNYALFESMTVFQNVSYALKLKKDPNYREKTAEILNRLGLAELKNKRPAQLSGGQQQRVAIARTLVLRPDIILFDEPFSALDVSTRLSMRREIKALQQEFGVTMIFVTHDQEEAFALSDRIMVMKDGRIQQIAAPADLIDHPANDFVREFVTEHMQSKIEDLARYRGDR